MYADVVLAKSATEAVTLFFVFSVQEKMLKDLLSKQQQQQQLQQQLQSARHEIYRTLKFQHK